MILVVVGTRPELLKMAPVVKLARERGLPIRVHCTMQSPDLVDRAILAWDSEGSLDMVLPGLREKVPTWATPEFVVVQGDTSTAYRAAVAAFEQGFPVFHLESGVRTYDLAAPWPEEGYRQMISRIAKWHACTTERNYDNLDREGIVARSWAAVTGSPIVESVRERLTQPVDGSVLSRPLVTLHRRENRPHFTDILEGVRHTFRGAPTPTLTPALLTHPNAWALQAWRTIEGWFPDAPIATHAPLPSVAFARSLANAPVVVTDSGGVQEEANALGVPCVVARTVTDRPESLGPRGGAILGGNTRESIATAIQQALQLDRSRIAPTIFGDGKASERLVDWWSEILQSSH